MAAPGRSFPETTGGLVGRPSERGYREERRLDHDGADRQDPNLVFCLPIHEIPTPETVDRSRVLEKRSAALAAPRLARVALFALNHRRSTATYLTVAAVPYPAATAQAETRRAQPSNSACARQRRAFCISLSWGPVLSPGAVGPRGPASTAIPAGPLPAVASNRMPTAPATSSKPLPPSEMAPALLNRPRS
jgi:hypothetical protein